MIYRKIKFLSLLILLTTISCKKDWLEKKRDISVIVPTTLADLRLLLNNDLPLNYDTRGIVEASADDITLTETMYNGILRPYERNAIVWNGEIWGANVDILEWETAYEQVNYANVILDALDKIQRTASNGLEFDNIKGSALFIRSRAFLNLVTTFAGDYEQATAASELGIPLKLTSNIYEQIKRASLADSYQRIVEDLTLASSLLPRNKTLRTQPAKAAGFGLLARTLLYMDRFADCKNAADSSLKYNSTLIDYNQLSASATFPIPSSNEELHIYSNVTRAYSSNNPANYSIDIKLYQSYAGNDLRKTRFFILQAGDVVRFRGGYLGNNLMCGATATNEMLLTRAECRARLNDASAAITDLNTLLLKRFITGTYVPAVATTADAALETILTERRKELLRRGLRWQDLKRLNRETRFQKTLTRTIGSSTFTLTPNSPRYIMPIPEYIIQRNGIQQNDRS